MLVESNQTRCQESIWERDISVTWMKLGLHKYELLLPLPKCCHLKRKKTSKRSADSSDVSVCTLLVTCQILVLIHYQSQASVKSYMFLKSPLKPISQGHLPQLCRLDSIYVIHSQSLAVIFSKSLTRNYIAL